MHAYPIDCQISLVIALCTLHNIIRKKGGEDVFFNRTNVEEQVDRANWAQERATQYTVATPQARAAASAHWDQIAEAMWAAYVTHPRRAENN